MKFKISKQETVDDGTVTKTQYLAKVLSKTGIVKAGKVPIEWPAPPPGYTGALYAHYVLTPKE